MFGMEKNKDNKIKPVEPTVFEMETALKKNPHKKKELVSGLQQRLNVVKKFLREGSNQKDFEQMGFVLHGYSACIKVINRIK